MKTILLALFLTCVGTAALAQTPEPKFVPFTVDEKAMQNLQAWLNEQPFKFAAPVIQWLAMQEQAAQQAEAAKKPKEAEPGK